MSKTFLIIGATGKVGAAVARALAAQGIRARLARHAARPDADGHDAVPFDYDDPGTIRAALDGVDGLFLLTPPSNRQADWAALTIDLAMSAGVDRIVRLSVAAAPLGSGAVSATTSTLANTLPSPPTSFADFAARHRDQLRARFSPG